MPPNNPSTTKDQDNIMADEASQPRMPGDAYPVYRHVIPPNADPDPELEPHPTYEPPVYGPRAQSTATTPAMNIPHQDYQHPSYEPDVTQQQFQEAVQQRNAAEHRAQGCELRATRLNQLWRNSGGL